MFLSQGQLTALQVLAVLGNGAAVVGLGIAVVRSLGASDWGPAVVYSVVAAINFAVGAGMAYWLAKRLKEGVRRV